MRLVIFGAPRTKKTSQRILTFGKFKKIVPSVAYLAWRDAVVPQLRAQAIELGIARPVNLCAFFYRDALRGDLIGYIQGLADVLQEAGILADDKWIEGLDGSRLLKDAEHPRVEFEIERLE